MISLFTRYCGMLAGWEICVHSESLKNKHTQRIVEINYKFNLEFFKEIIYQARITLKPT